MHRSDVLGAVMAETNFYTAPERNNKPASAADRALLICTTSSYAKDSFECLLSFASDTGEGNRVLPPPPVVDSGPGFPGRQV